MLHSLRPYTLAAGCLAALSLACSSITITFDKPQAETPAPETWGGGTPAVHLTQPPDLPSVTTPATQGEGLRLRAVEANSNRNLAIDEHGRVWEWGTYETGPANSPCKNPGVDCKLSPSLVPGLSEVTAVSPGYDHNLALRADGTVWGWGQNETFQLGLGYQDQEYHRTPIQVPGLAGVKAISASANFSLALLEDGSVWAWGHNESGQLGDGKDSYTPDYPLREETPFQVVGLSDVVAIGTGTAHSVALRRDGTVWTWGENQLGNLGWGTADTEQHPVPQQTPGLSDVVAIRAGFLNTQAITADGRVWVWGGNMGNQLCLGGIDFSPHPEPIELTSFAGFVQVVPSSMQTIGLMSDGSVSTCGMMEGFPMTWDFIQVPGLSGIQAITAGEDHAAALDSDGGLWAWGFNSVGQIGDGTMENRPSPVPVMILAP